MKVPINWLENYIKLNHTYKEFADIMTFLEFMQDGPMEEINGQTVLDLEVRQNRSDSFSIIGLAREYAAYINKKITLPETLKELPENVEWGKPEKLIDVQAKSLVKRFTAVKIKNIKVKESPDWIRNNLEAYGIPSINNIVDITNYVMLEFGMPLHAFDLRKLSPNKESKALLDIRKAEPEEILTTWQGTEVKLVPQDLIISSGNKPVAMAGVIGGANSDIENDTTEIILESACYDQASVRKSSIRHNLRTDASTRHEKFLNPEMVEPAIRRALFLIQDIAEGEIEALEDFYEKPQPTKIIEFNIFEISRIGGIELKASEVIDILNRLGFEVTDQKEAIGINQNNLYVKIPDWRTDVNIEADLIEEVLRLWGYDKIPLQPIRESAEDFSTTKSILVEDKIKDILVGFNLDEHITNPLVKFSNKPNQILLENPLNTERNALRTEISDTLNEVVSNYIKNNIDEFGIFESGKVYKKIKEASFTEEKVTTTIYHNQDFVKVIKPDLKSLLLKLGFPVNKMKTKFSNEHTFSYYWGNTLIADLQDNGYTIYVDNLTEIVNVQNIPNIKVINNISQKITEELTLIVKDDVELGKISGLIYEESELISEVYIINRFKDDSIDRKSTAISFAIIFEDQEKSLTKESVKEIKDKIIINLSKKLGISLKKAT